MTNLITFLASNQQLLTQLQSTLKKIGSSGQSIYSSAIPVIGGASIGAHLRHVLDFYTAFYYGAKSGQIDYDDRQRDIETEKNLKVGIFQLSVVIEQLETMRHLNNQNVEVNATVEVESVVSFGQSNLIRELQSLHSHTTHHMAIIAIVLKLNGLLVGDDFGKAPSTIKYESTNKFESHLNVPLN